MPFEQCADAKSIAEAERRHLFKPKVQGFNPADANGGSLYAQV